MVYKDKYRDTRTELNFETRLYKNVMIPLLVEAAFSFQVVSLCGVTDVVWKGLPDWLLLPLDVVSSGGVDDSREELKTTVQNKKTNQYKFISFDLTL